MPEDNEPAEMIDTSCEAEASDTQLFFPENEEKILAATLRAFESGSLTPLIKEELRCTIQSRRLAAGKGELRLEEFKKPPKKKPMTDEEKKREQTRRVQNREAAQRFRQRQKDQACYLSDKIRRLERASTSLQSEMKRLKDERDELKMMLQDHLVVCTKNLPPPEITYSIDHLLQHMTNPPTHFGNFSLATPQCPDTSDSTSSVFFPDELSCNQSNHLMCDGLLQGLDAETFEIIEDNGSMMQDLVESPEIGQEMVIGGNDLSDSEYSDDLRLETCSSLETVSNYSSVSSENFSTGDTNIDLAATFSMVEMNFCYQPFETSIITDDILLLDGSIS